MHPKDPHLNSLRSIKSNDNPAFITRRLFLKAAAEIAWMDRTRDQAIGPDDYINIDSLCINGRSFVRLA